MFFFGDTIINPPIIAHRGASAQAPENTLSAFLKAKKLGLNWVEFDVSLTATGEVVVIHDDDLDRTSNGSGKVVTSSYDYLKTLDVGSWFASNFANERLITLEQLFEFLIEYKLSANLEIKTPPAGLESLLVDKIMHIVEAYAPKLSGELLISSFSLPVLQLVRKNYPTYALGFLMDEWQADWLKICDELQAVSVNVNVEILNIERIGEIKKSGRMLLAYTVDDPVLAKQLLNQGVDAIFSNCPKQVVDAFDLQSR